MHSCSEVPSSKGKEDADCLNHLTSNYSFIYRVGDKETVSASLVFKLSQDRQDVAVKVMPLPSEDSIKDVRIACMLNNVAETPVFVKTFGWLKCSEIPSLWLKGLNIKKDAPRSFARSKMFLFQVMAFSSHTWSDPKIQLDVEEYRVMLFMLLHGLWVAQEKFQFRHNDIHEGQILFQTCKPDTVVTLAVGENRYTLKCERFIPKLIDFGFATLGEKKEEEESSGEESMFERSDEEEEDVRNLFYTFEKRMGKSHFVRDKRYTSLQDILLFDPIFESIRKASPVEIKQSYFCDVCSSVATSQWERQPFYFCGETCSDSLLIKNLF